MFEGAGALLRGDLDFISKKYNKPIPAEEATLIALISGSDVLQAEAEREESVNMCTALERLAEENRQRGIEQGIAQGRCEERDATVKALLLQGLLPEQKIAEAVNISMEQLQEIRENDKEKGVDTLLKRLLSSNVRVLRIKAVENLLERLGDKI